MPVPNSARQITFGIVNKLGLTSEVMPGIPPGAKLAPGSSVRPEQCGKVPGKFNASTGTWSGYGGRWSIELKAREQDLMKWAKWRANVCLQTRFFCCLDIDVEDAHAVSTIEDLAERQLGPAPIRYREGGPRKLRMYCIADETIKKHRLAWKDTAAKLHAVELLGDGQQCVIGGFHPSGSPYLWDEWPSAYDLTPIGLKHVQEFFAELEKLVRDAGYELVASTADAGGGSGTRKSIDDPTLHAPTPQHVLNVLKVWRPEHMAHDEYVQATAAIKASLGPDREQYFADFMEWSPGARSAEHNEGRKRWDSIADSELGWEWLAAQGRAHGYSGDAQTDFADDAPLVPQTPYDSMLARYAWVEGLARYNDTRGGGFLGSREFNAANVAVKPFGGSGQQTAEAIFQNAPNARKVATATSRPGEPVITIDENERGIPVPAVNLWRPSAVKAKPNVTVADIGPWLDLLGRLFGPEGAEEREHFLNWWAFLLQNPGRKIGHAVVIIGGQGVGKDTVLTPLSDAVGQHNVAPVDGQTLAGQWTYFLKAQIVYVQELANARRDFYNQLKPYISGQKSRLAVNEKGLRQYFVPNHQNWIFTSNSDTALAPDEDDRRFWICRVLAEEPQPPEYFDKLHKWLDAGGTAAVLGWLLQRDVSAFNPMAKPPMTAAKQAMLDQAQPAGVRWAREQFGEGGTFASRSIVRVEEITSVAAEQWNAPTDLNSKHITTALKLQGFKPAHRVRLGKEGMRQLWANGASSLLLQLTAEKMRERYLAETSGTATAEAAA